MQRQPTQPAEDKDNVIRGQEQKPQPPGQQSQELKSQELKSEISHQQNSQSSQSNQRPPLLRRNAIANINHPEESSEAKSPSSDSEELLPSPPSLNRR